MEVFKMKALFPLWILYNFCCLAQEAKQVYIELNDLNWPSPVSYMTVFRWVKKSKLKYANLKGHQKTSVANEIVSAMKAFVAEKGRYTVEEIANKMRSYDGVHGTFNEIPLYHSNIKNTTVQDSYRPAICSQKTDMDITCEDLVPERGDNRPEVSVWPPGPYALPMSVYGCPEERSKGWYEGTVLLTFKNSSTVYTSRVQGQPKETGYIFDWPELDRFLYQHMTSNSVQMHFCFKRKQNTTEDIGSFPAGNYSIYADKSGCMEDFALFERNMTFPAIDYWISDGHLPDFHIYEYESYAVLSMFLCVMSVSDSPKVNTTRKYPLFDTPFVMIANLDWGCPDFWHHLEQESVNSYTMIKGNISMQSHVQSYCFNYPKTWKTPNERKLYDKLMKSGYILSQMHITNGNTSVKPRDMQDTASDSAAEPKMSHVYSLENQMDTNEDNILSQIVLQLLGGVYEERTYIQWKIIDLGRTLDVTGIKLDVYFAIFVSSRITQAPQPFVSNEKWSFLYSRARRSPYIPTYNTIDKNIAIMFLRPMSGRYIALIETSGGTFLQNMSSVEVFILLKIYDDMDGCNVDLGMTDGAIRNGQTNSSSFQTYFNQWEVRPHHVGWCADKHDKDPFIVIDFLHLTLVEGVTIWNWKLTSIVQENTAFEVTYKFGAEEFNVYYAISRETFIQYGTSFMLDKYNEDDEQITFRFLNPFIARYLKLKLVRSFTEGMMCLKFELHGCPGIYRTPTLYKNSADDAVVTNIQYILSEGFISSPDFPEFYKNGQLFKWIIKTNNDTFITLIFTRISLKSYKSLGESCSDRVLVSKHLVDVHGTARSIDYRLNSQVFMLETSESLLVLSFVTCLQVGKREDNRTGFQVIVSHKSTPPCFEIDSSLSWENGRHEECLMTAMNIKPMSFWGLPFVGTVERWTINSVRRRIKIYVKDFRVPCLRDGIGSEFMIEDSAHQYSYCNLNRPPDIFYSYSDTLIVTFRKNEDFPNTRYTVGFWIEYQIEEVSLEHLIDFQATTSKLTNVAINKPAIMSSADRYLPKDPGNGNDGDISSFETERSFLPWWMVDLKDTYRVEFMVLIYRFQFELEKSRETQRNLEVYTGFDDISLLLTFFHCGSNKQFETLPFHNIHTRYIKLQQKYPSYEVFRLNEVEVYGELDITIDEDLRNYHINRTKEKFAQFQVLAESQLYWPYTCPMTELENSDYSSWSTWTECSVKCGIGSRQRLRNCILNETKLCLGEDTHFQKCIGNGSCPVCIYKFKKCYSFFADLTNWQNAGYECWRRYMTLVSIDSLEELQFLKYKLREKRYVDMPVKINETSFKFNASYFVHIGLHRTNSTYSSNKFLWEDISQVIFSAWKPGEPVKGSCVRMNYKYYQPDDTWEAEDCIHDLADYFVCERPAKINEHAILDTNEDVRFLKYDSNWREVNEQIRTSAYNGTINVTSDGSECLPWTTYPENSGWFFRGKEISEVQNFCRDPDDSGFIWCYVEDDERYAWSEGCSVPMPEKEHPSFSILTYQGSWDLTVTGKQCKRWYEQLIYSEAVLTGTTFFGETLKKVSNFCRDPFNYGYLWCYTSDPNYVWETCVVPDTASKRCSDILDKYIGYRNSTFSGKECQRWNMYPSFLENYNKLSDEEILDTESYCRDPFKDGYLWCYTGESETDWEPCYVSGTQSVGNVSPISDIRESFQCDNGKKIPLRNKCDNKIDCEDLTDETKCWKSYTNHKLVQEKNMTELPRHLETSSFFRCGSLEFISVLMKCDQVKDCADASDEFGCITNAEQPECAEDEFSCTDGDCIHVSQVCNHVIDCVDSTDEYCDFGTCQSNENQCENGECISEDKRCDGFVHCLDATDEANCETCNSIKAFHCDVTKCIDKRLVCDTYADCEDGGDESNCYKKGLSSCQDVWHAGYRQTGIYNINGIDALCYFDSVLSSNIIYLYILNRDIYWLPFSHPSFPEYSYRGYTYVRQGKETLDSDVESIFIDQRFSCYTETKQTCSPVHSAIMEFDEQYYKDTLGFCFCGNMVVTCLFGCRSKRECSEYPHTSDIGKDLISYHGALIVSITSLYTPSYEIISKPLMCSYTFRADENVLVCEKDVKVIPNHMRCVYDIDSTGIVIGCRSASHLKNCETFECPEDTVKCPESYCIPLHFVCDGEMQCPGGQDEEDCGCSPEENEVVMLVHKRFLENNLGIISGFAKQFSNDRNIVRLLSYETTAPLINFGIETKLLNITEQQIQGFSTVNRVTTCQYNIMADRFLSTLKFSKTLSRGFIFFETDADAENVTKSLFSKNIIYKAFGFHPFRILEQPNSESTMQTKYDNVTDISVPRWKVLSKIGSSFFPELCTVASNRLCPNEYKCSSSKMCISLDHICDGRRHCPHGDDELLCEFMCPENCTCTGFAIDCRNNNLDMNAVRILPVQTRQLDISLNKNLSIIFEESNLNMKQLVRLNVSYCNVREISRNAFLKIFNLKTLDVSYNLFTILRKNVFRVLVHLTSLYLHGSYELVTIEAGAFAGLFSVQGLQLVDSKLREIAAYTFSGLSLKYIDFSNNNITSIADFAFDDLSVDKINFENNEVKQLNRKIFSGVRNLKELKASAYKFCCIRPTYLLEQDCYPQKDEFSSCEDLMRISALQTMLWLVGISSLIGNVLSIIYRLIYDRERLKLGYGIFVTNLAVADFLMGIYLIIIAIADAVYRKRYIYVDEYWRGSGLCTFAGVLSTISSEASVLFLCLITLDRLFVIKFPFGQIRFDSVNAYLCSFLAWAVSLFIALLPVVYESYFKNEFYSKSGVCIALPLTRDRPPGWIYSVMVFVGLNFVTFLLVAFGQILIFWEVRKSSSRMKKMQSARRKDLTVARNLLLVVTTDFLCWFPIGVMGMMAMSGHVISGDVYAWTAVFILPINSALNPVLYTASAIIGRTTFNPSTDEQARTELSNELGNYIKEYQSIGKQLSMRFIPPKEKFRRIADILESDVKVLASAIMKSSFELFRCLEILHRAFLVVGKIDKSTVCISVQMGELTGNVCLTIKPTSTSKKEDLRNDILQAGKVLNALVQKCMKQKNDIY